jgi:hypothetical protein
VKSRRSSVRSGPFPPHARSQAERHRSTKPGSGGSIPPGRTTRGCSSTIELLSCKQKTVGLTPRTSTNHATIISMALVRLEHVSGNFEPGIDLGFPPIVSILYDNGKRPRKLYRHVCHACRLPFFAPLSAHKECCTTSCRGKLVQTRTSVPLECATCHVTFLRQPSHLVRSKHGIFFCSRLCKETAQRIDSDQPIRLIQPPHYGTAKAASNYRERALRFYGSKCSECGYCEHKEMLDVDHRDGKRNNRAIENLQVLCVWCHAWKTRMVDRALGRRRTLTLIAQ